MASSQRPRAQPRTPARAAARSACSHSRYTARAPLSHRRSGPARQQTRAALSREHAPPPHPADPPGPTGQPAQARPRFPLAGADGPTPPGSAFSLLSQPPPRSPPGCSPAFLWARTPRSPRRLINAPCGLPGPRPRLHRRRKTLAPPASPCSAVQSTLRLRAPAAPPRLRHRSWRRSPAVEPRTPPSPPSTTSALRAWGFPRRSTISAAPPDLNANGPGAASPPDSSHGEH
jgi:hypothetical protein